MATDEEESNQSFADRVRELRSKIQRKERATRAKRRARARRVRKDDPDNAVEDALAKRRRVSEATEQLRGLKEDARGFVRTKLNRDSGSSDASSDGGMAVDVFDADGDGDLDIVIDREPVEGEPGGDGTGGEDAAQFEPPVGDVEDDFQELQPDGVEEELGIDFPLEDVEAPTEIEDERR